MQVTMQSVMRAEVTHTLQNLSSDIERHNWMQTALWTREQTVKQIKVMLRHNDYRPVWSVPIVAQFDHIWVALASSEQGHLHRINGFVEAVASRHFHRHPHPFSQILSRVDVSESAIA
jgi:hypothetical protein